jgi:hypothetical protein
LYCVQAAAESFAASFSAALDALESDPDTPAPGFSDCHPLSCVTLCDLR